MEQQPPDEAASDAGPPSLRIGGRVISANATPTFASDPQLGAKGVVQQLDEAGASYLVRWEDGSESWARRDQLSPAGRGAIARPTGPRPTGPQGAGGPPRPPAGPRSGGSRLAGRVGPLIFAVFVLQGVLRPLLRGDHHVDAGALVFVAIIGIPLVLGVVRWLRRSTNG